jgi:hypothetical protein
VAIPLPCASQAGEDVAGGGACSYSDFVSLASPVAFSGVNEWCQVGLPGEGWPVGACSRSRSQLTCAAWAGQGCSAPVCRHLGPPSHLLATRAQACGNTEMAACKAYQAGRQPQGLSAAAVAAVALATVLVAMLVAGLTALLAWRHLGHGGPALLWGGRRPALARSAVGQDYVKQLDMVVPGEASTV